MYKHYQHNCTKTFTSANKAHKDINAKCVYVLQRRNYTILIKLSIKDNPPAVF